MRLEITNEGESSVVNLYRVRTGCCKLRGCEAHELRVHHYITRAITHNHLRVVRVIYTYRKRASGNSSVEL